MLIGGAPEPRARIFISYRRDDTSATAEHLHTSLGRRFGKEKVFRDLDTLAPGEDFAAEIKGAIAGTSVFIALIGRRWLTIKGRDGRRRLDDENDFVRLEIEAGLRHARRVIPVLVDDAVMPSREELPSSIADLAAHHAVHMSWHQDVAKIGREIVSVERERAAQEAATRAEHFDLTAGRSGPPVINTHAALGVVVEAMEMSLNKQGRPKQLSAADLERSMRKLTHRDVVADGFVFADLIHAIDLIGVKAKRGTTRYVARSYPVGSLEEAVAQLARDRPVLCSALVTDDWWKAENGVIDFEEPGGIQGATVCAIVGWDRHDGLQLLTPWSGYGDGGKVTLTERAAKHVFPTPEMRSIEPVERPEPYTTES